MNAPSTPTIRGVREMSGIKREDSVEGLKSRKMNKKRRIRSKQKPFPKTPFAESAQHVRALTPLEFGYARAHFRLLSWGHIIAVVIGLAMVPMSFEIAELIGGEFHPGAPYLILFAPLLVLASLGLGVFIIYFAPKRTCPARRRVRFRRNHGRECLSAL